MENKELHTLFFTIILIQDPHREGYTAFVKQLPNIITEGNTEDEAIHNLFNAVHGVFNYQNEINNAITGKDLKVYRKSNFLCSKIDYNIEIYEMIY